MVNPATEYRYERKFAIDEVSVHEVLGQLTSHPALFAQAYPPRYVNNIYFDSHQMCTYYANMDGLANRLKVRLRWYGDLFGTITNPALEFKLKQGLVGSKKTFAMEDFVLNQNSDISDLAGWFAQADIEPQFARLLHYVHPTLLNRYYRQYYISADGQFRVTIDTELEYYRIQPFRNTFLHRTMDRKTTILEIKYPQDKAHQAPMVTNSLSFRMTRNSKYINGIEALNR